MGESSYEIQHEQEQWVAGYDCTSPNGPLYVSQDGVVFLKNLQNCIDDRPMDVEKTRANRKGGKAVNDTEVSLYGRNASGFRQITRYGNNVCRVTTDVIMKRGTIVKKYLRLGSFTLPGKWVRLLEIPLEGEAFWSDLSVGVRRHSGMCPLAWVFEREDGFRVELSAGFDLWRWRNGLEGTEQETLIDVREDELFFDRHLVSVPETAQVETEDGEAAGVEPGPRDYRFCYQLAWSVASVKQEAVESVPPMVDISSGSLGELPPDMALSIDLGQLPVSALGCTDGDASRGICWESNASLQYAKRIIRQLAAAGDKGWLHIAGGLEPSVCTCGKHVDRPRGKTPHWDLNGIICFSQWVRQTLGADWRITYESKGIWSELPSMQCLFGPNGFSVE